MNCTLCGKEIENYNVEFHRFEPDKDKTADICPNCADKFLKWQGRKFAALFPTAAMKKRYGSGNLSK